MPTALYKSRAWLFREYVVLKKSPEEIARQCGVVPMTIYRYMTKFGLKR